VKLPDVNLLLYALDETLLHHARAQPWLEALLSGTEPADFAWSVLVTFVRPSTRHHLFAHPMTPPRHST
jgi:predicted nucleic acid-binding protein